ncbi:uncharacterized protein EDB91DRAFT_1275572 [Suillus paluster]|uniref:uncharacterized protein n=1 Tax=Suillus paluster TaxID=48578 RepID=UPI001B85C0CB|nr:uncharacterized protein EDB91DRAFT_1275572 [Suillus paluster]KAG1721586.1 hypothetical protein EDB91DRAFT_1275572 [Suillus paluster]
MSVSIRSHALHTRISLPPAALVSVFLYFLPGTASWVDAHVKELEDHYVPHLGEIRRTSIACSGMTSWERAKGGTMSPMWLKSLDVKERAKAWAATRKTPGDLTKDGTKYSGSCKILVTPGSQTVPILTEQKKSDCLVCNTLVQGGDLAVRRVKNCTTHLIPSPASTVSEKKVKLGHIVVESKTRVNVIHNEICFQQAIVSYLSIKFLDICSLMLHEASSLVSLH